MSKSLSHLQQKINHWHRQRTRLWLIASLLLVILLAIPAYSWMRDTNKDMASRRRSRLSPVFMIPGSSATTERFNDLVTLLNANTKQNIAS